MADTPSKGLTLFPKSKPAQENRRRKVFLVLGILICAGLIWPVYTLFDSAEPGLFGFPVSLTWIVFELLAMLGLLIWLFRTDHPK